jgi:hypothetical protein
MQDTASCTPYNHTDMLQSSGTNRKLEISIDRCFNTTELTSNFILLHSVCLILSHRITKLMYNLNLLCNLD